MTNLVPKVRFAPSPTGFLHVGNVRAAIINFLYAKKFGGQFFLRLDDTDSQRVSDEYRQMIFEDMDWLGLEFDSFFKQSDRLEKYEAAKQKLLACGALYECFETNEELNLQRKSQIASGVAPIYNRASLKLTAEQKATLRAQGLRPHYRFLLADKPVSWHDKIKGLITYDGRHFSDPVLIRQEDETGFGVPTYTFCSVVDDIEFEITDIIRGEDHITNTAIQIQIFEALEAKLPYFAHLALVKAAEGKISKREGGFDIKTLRKDGYEPMAIVNLLSQIGTSEAIEIFQNYDELTKNFSFEKFSKSATNYDIGELSNINQKLLQSLSYEMVLKRLRVSNHVANSEELRAHFKISPAEEQISASLNSSFDMPYVDKVFSDNSSLSGQNNLQISTDSRNLGVESGLSEKSWFILRSNISFLHELGDWLLIIHKGFRYRNSDVDHEFLKQCLAALPQDTSQENSWGEWLEKIKAVSQRKGKALFMPIRLALTGQEHGPELKHLVNLIERDEIIARLQS